ncbi:MAG: trimeric intracellular cation channel family protein [Flavobacteriales bacterium]|nr:trimeric intracellular cation channel family protein [Flavobacteriales bacterium]
MNLVYVFEIIGTFVFAVSGVSTAASKRFDIVGVSIIAFVTAIGGGTLRDVMIGVQPVSWMLDQNYIYTIFAAVGLSFFFLPYLLKLRRTLFIFDTIGLGLFAIIGLEKALAAGLTPVVAIMMGTVSAVFGGVLRDILSNSIPLIFGGRLYASICVVGGIVYLLLIEMEIPKYTTMIATVFFIIILRSLSVKFKWSLPQIK